MNNVDRPQELSLPGEPLSSYRGWVRGGGGLFLITSRDTELRTWDSAAALIALTPLATHEAAEVLVDAGPEAGTSWVPITPTRH